MSDLDLDRLRESLEWWESHPKIDETTAQLHWLNSVPIIAAARRFLALTETGPDYGEGMRKLMELAGEVPVLDFNDPEDQRMFAAAVDVALADYLTEEGP